MAVFDAHKNLAVATVLTAPSPATSGTSLTVAAGEGARFQAAPFNATVWSAAQLPTPVTAEVVRVTARAGDVLTIARTQEGTGARTIVAGDLIAATITAKTITDLESALTAVGLWVDLTPTATANTGSAIVATNFGYRYTLIGKTIIVAFFLDLTIGGSPTVVALNLPAGVTISPNYHAVPFIRGSTMGMARCNPSGTTIDLTVDIAGAVGWSAGQIYVTGTAIASVI